MLGRPAKSRRLEDYIIAISSGLHEVPSLLAYISPPEWYAPAYKQAGALGITPF